VGWTWCGALAGVFLVFATLFSFLAIPLAGLATAAATWSCSAVLVAFLWGAAGPGKVAQPMKSVLLSILAVAILIGGVLVLNLRAQLSARFCKSARGVTGMQDQILIEDGGVQQGNAGQKLLGLASAISVGIFGGSILVPSKYVREEVSGIGLLPSFGVGAGIVGTLVGLFYWIAVKKQPLATLSEQLPMDTVLKGMLSGLLWNISNIAQVVAMNYLHMAYGISYPILQCGLLVAGLWGIYFFKEVEDRGAVCVFWLGAAILMLGVVLLGLFGPGTAS